MKVRLRVKHDKANVKRVVLTRDTVIGRATDCSLRIASKQVSRRHCVILVGDEAVAVRDLGSSNGTFVDGTRVEPQTEVPVPSGAKLSVGGIQFLVDYHEPAPALAATPATDSSVNLTNEDTIREPGTPTPKSPGNSTLPDSGQINISSAEPVPFDEDPDALDFEPVAEAVEPVEAAPEHDADADADEAVERPADFVAAKFAEYGLKPERDDEVVADELRLVENDAPPTVLDADVETVKFTEDVAAEADFVEAGPIEQLASPVVDAPEESEPEADPEPGGKSTTDYEEPEVDDDAAVELADEYVEADEVLEADAALEADAVLEADAEPEADVELDADEEWVEEEDAAFEFLEGDAEEAEIPPASSDDGALGDFLKGLGDE